MFVIFGAGGNVGKVSAAALRRAGRHVRAVVHSVAQADALSQIGCDVALADLHDRTAVARALEGAHAVQILCPVPRHHDDPENEMRGMIDVSVEALRANPPPHVLALSDYGAEHASGTGITTLFHYLETQLGTVDTRLTFLRAAEHMHNWRAYCRSHCRKVCCRACIIRWKSAFLLWLRRMSARWRLNCCSTASRLSVRRAWSA